MWSFCYKNYFVVDACLRCKGNNIPLYIFLMEHTIITKLFIWEQHYQTLIWVIQIIFIFNYFFIPPIFFLSLIHQCFLCFFFGALCVASVLSARTERFFKMLKDAFHYIINNGIDIQTSHKGIFVRFYRKILSELISLRILRNNII